MNILWLSHLVPYPPKGGVLQRSYNLLLEVSKEHDIYLLAFNQKNLLADNEELDEAKSALLEFCKEVRILPLESELFRWRKIALLFLNFLSPDPYDVNWTKSKKMHREVVAMLSSFRIDLVHLDTIGLAQYRHHFRGISAILNHHNIESDMIAHRTVREKNILKRIYFLLEAKKLRRLEKQVCHEFSINLTVSDLDKNRLKAINPKASTTTVDNGVDIEYFQPDRLLDDSEQSLLFVGGLGWYPNRDAMEFFLNDIWPILHNQFPSLILYIVGRSSHKDVERIRRSKRNVVVTGFVDDARIYFKKATVLICPMRTGGGTRLKILDALACGKAIVATSMACEGIAVTNRRNVMIADTPSEFCSAIEALLHNPDLRSLLGMEARLLAEKKYSWTSIGKKLRDAYDAAFS